MHILAITDGNKRLVEADWLVRAESIHRQLRPQLPADYLGVMAAVMADGGEMIVAIEGQTVMGLAVFRSFRDTFNGLRFYVDDLVTDETQRSQGVGHALIAWLETEARRRGATNLSLESGTQRTQAHKFYFREGFVIPSFSFRKPL
ncbi:GNAT family N-acetyltransferase [Chitinivorax sp. B]|uniref:GNAT family N-acetyltransferase n=1 Tax=Chitinivorax sp. B TaxID=2502235 RepID=UPI0010F57C6D|nr:GNAT family N-acetyltransferase [Chitinivorax sp. B]